MEHGSVFDKGYERHSFGINVDPSADIGGIVDIAGDLSRRDERR